MWTLIFFGILSVLLLWISRRTLFDFHCHGFYRFFAWEGIAWLLVSNYRFWFDAPFGLRQIISWTFLIFSIYLVLAGVMLLKKKGKPTAERAGEQLYAFEKTANLVDKGIYRYIRHPLYASLLFLAWGILLKHPTLPLLMVTGVTTVLLYLTAYFDEKECVAYFGDPYLAYMKRSKRFVPFIF